MLGESKQSATVPIRTAVMARCRGLAIAVVALTALLVSVAPPASADTLSDRPAASATFDAEVRAVAYRGNVIFVGGDFTQARDGQTTAVRKHIAAVDASGGGLLDWTARTDGAVQAIAVHGDSVYLGGDFGRVNGVRRNGLAKLDAVTGELDAEFAPSVSGRVLALAIAHDRLYLGGSFYEIDRSPRSGLGAVALDTGALDGQWRPEADGRVRTIAADGSRVYLGGSFGALNGERRHRKLAAVDPTTGEIDPGFATGISVLVRDLEATPDGVYAALGGQGGRLVSYDPDGVTEWAVTADGDLQALTLLGGVIYVGGHFSEICTSARTGRNGDCLDGSAPRGRLAAVDASGTLLNWSPDANSAVGVLAMASHPTANAVAVGGAFTTLGSGEIDQPYFACFR